MTAADSIYGARETLRNLGPVVEAAEELGIELPNDVVDDRDAWAHVYGTLKERYRMTLTQLVFAEAEARHLTMFRLLQLQKDLGIPTNEVGFSIPGALKLLTKVKEVRSC